MSARQPTRQGCTGKRPRGQRTPSHHVTLQSKDAMASIQSFSWSSSSLPLTLVPLDLVQLHLFLMIQLSMVILETHTVWIRHISTKDGKMETCRIRPETKTVQILLWPGRRPNFLFTWSPRAIEPERPGRSSKGKPKGHWPRRPGRSSEEITQLQSPDLQLLLVLDLLLLFLWFLLFLILFSSTSSLWSSSPWWF